MGKVKIMECSFLELKTAKKIRTGIMRPTVDVELTLKSSFFYERWARFFLLSSLNFL